MEIIERARNEDIPATIKKGPKVCSSLCRFFEGYECEQEQLRYTQIKRVIDGIDPPGGLKGNANELIKQFKFEGKKYLNQLQAISNGETKTFVISIQDIQDYGATVDAVTEADGLDMHEVLHTVVIYTARSIRLITIAAEQIRNTYCPASDDSIGLSIAYLLLAETRLPIWYKAPFDVQLIPQSKVVCQSLREINDSNYGSLMKIEAIVSKVITAKPKMHVARYRCNVCQGDAFQPVDDDDFAPLRTCESESCKLVQRSGNLTLIPKDCKMVKHETVIVQEPTHHCPPGNVPRQLEIVLEGSLTGILKPGMNCTITGHPFPVDIKGFSSIYASLVRDVGFVGHHVAVHKQNIQFSDYERDVLEMRVRDIIAKPDFYSLMATAICPSIYGHENVKKALLLQLVGAPSLSTNAGLNVRGEIHVLLMGDPGVAKSQLLNKIIKVAPRAQYTTGKGASGVGLTASIVKDPVTGEFSLQGGSIVLADTGICCIDEFDKMDEGDRTAIHEVMEQQTVSVSKAGFNVQLNARTAILAAANPVAGRYDISKSAVENMKLPYSLISRFDLQFLLLDTVDSTVDRNLAHHILSVHQVGSNLESALIDQTTLRYFIAKAQQYSPTINEDVRTELKARYVDMRAQERFNQQMQGKEDSYTTPRALFSLVRLAQAHARIRFASEVSMEDVEEACRITEASKASIKVGITEEEATMMDAQSSIVDLLRNYEAKQRKTTEYSGFIDMAEFEVHVLTRGFSTEQVRDTIRNYVELGVLRYKTTKEREVTFVED